MATQSRVICKLLLLVLLPLLLYIVPTEGIFSGESICLIKSIFGIECWGCGITRAFFSVLYFDFAAAWEYNPLIYILLPLLLWLWARELYSTVCKLRQK